MNEAFKCEAYSKKCLSIISFRNKCYIAYHQNLKDNTIKNDNGRTMNAEVS